MLDADTKCDIRRHLGYPEQGFMAQVGMVFGLTPMQDRLEIRMNQLQPIAEAKITGHACGVVTLTGNQPHPGNQIVLTITSTALLVPETVTITAVDGDTTNSLCMRLAAAVNQNLTLAAASFSAMGPYGDRWASETTLRCPTAFSMVVTSTGEIGAAVTRQGTMPSPYAVVGKSLGQPVVVYGYVPLLNNLESARLGATRNLDMAKAGDFIARPDELAQRKKLYDDFRRDLANFLQVEIMNSSAGGVQTLI